mmetsp:Transcript_24317/g.65952  ORF Transcript_24317/g.65952 Transcript_24317/m.65952 type:complete len:344 (-) Transcript_24317:8-1039(-)
MLGAPPRGDLLHGAPELGAQHLLVLKVFRVPLELERLLLALPVLDEELGPDDGSHAVDGHECVVVEARRVAHVAIDHRKHAEDTKGPEVVGVDVHPGKVEGDLLSKVVADLIDRGRGPRGGVDPSAAQALEARLVLEGEIAREDLVGHELIQVLLRAGRVVVRGRLDEVEECADALQGREEVAIAKVIWLEAVIRADAVLLVDLCMPVLRLGKLDLLLQAQGARRLLKQILARTHEEVLHTRGIRVIVVLLREVDHVHAHGLDGLEAAEAAVAELCELRLALSHLVRALLPLLGSHRELGSHQDHIKLALARLHRRGVAPLEHWPGQLLRSRAGLGAALLSEA